MADTHEIGPAELNRLPDDILFERVDAAVERDDAAPRSGRRPLAAFITMAVMERVRQRIRKQTGLGGGNRVAYLTRAKRRRGGWGEQASFARAIADLTGGRMPPNDGSAERMGNDADANLRKYNGRIEAIKKQKKSDARDEHLRAEQQRLYVCAYGCTRAAPFARAVPLECTLRPASGGTPEAMYAMAEERVELLQLPRDAARERKKAEAATEVRDVKRAVAAEAAEMAERAAEAAAAAVAIAKAASSAQAMAEERAAALAEETKAAEARAKAAAKAQAAAESQKAGALQTANSAVLQRERLLADLERRIAAAVERRWRARLKEELPRLEEEVEHRYEERIADALKKRNDALKKRKRALELKAEMAAEKRAAKEQLATAQQSGVLHGKFGVTQNYV